MKAYPIPQGGIHIELEDADDWRLLARMLRDARDDAFDLAANVGGHIPDEEIAEDWQDFVMPDLRDQFDGQLERVTSAIARAHEAHQGGGGRVLVARDAGADWYGVLNRARLALESRYKLAEERGDGEEGPARGEHAARLRDRLYCALQSLLLDHAFD